MNHATIQKKQKKSDTTKCFLNFCSKALCSKKRESSFTGANVIEDVGKIIVF